MYYGVQVTKEEEYMQLYMWRFEGEGSIKTIAICSQTALKKTAMLNDNANSYPAAAKALTLNSYDDNTFQ